MLLDELLQRSDVGDDALPLHLVKSDRILTEATHRDSPPVGNREGDRALPLLQLRILHPQLLQLLHDGLDVIDLHIVLFGLLHRCRNLHRPDDILRSDGSCLLGSHGDPVDLSSGSHGISNVIHMVNSI